ncbi:hypothetical protein K2X83_02685 [Patescibacteria group bacterium]|nr:hypothetical protein [Patescibacteria group bacterium]
MSVWKEIQKGAPALCAGAVFFALFIFFSTPTTNITPKFGLYAGKNLSTTTDFSNAQVSRVILAPLDSLFLVHQLGVEETLKKLVEQAKFNNHGVCHFPAHKTGEAAYNLYGADAISKCDSSCHFGCVHGVMERIVAEEGGTKLIQLVQEQCSQYDTAFDRYSCFHGSGHGILTAANFDVEDGINTCLGLPSGEAQDGCFEGVFMENFDSGGGKSSGAERSWVSKEDIHFPCSAFTGNPRITHWCYTIQAHWFRKVYNDDLTRVTAECLRAPEDGIPGCIGDIGKYILSEHMGEPRFIEEYCASVPHRYYESCISISSRLMLQHYDRDPTGQGVQFCVQMKEERAKALCYRVQSETLVEMYPTISEREHICRLFEGSYVEACLVTVNSS